MWTKKEDHDGPTSLNWANKFAYLILKFHHCFKIFV